MLADLMTKPIGGEHFHAMAHAILCNHHFSCLNNRGVKENLHNMCAISNTCGGRSVLLRINEEARTLMLTVVSVQQKGVA